MDSLNCSSDQCIQIDNIQQFEQIAKFLRNPDLKYSGPFPVYLEKICSVTRGESIGLIYEPIGTFTGKPLIIIEFQFL